MSISFVEFQKLLHPAIPEKFKLIYEILYYYKIDVDELVNLTADRVILRKDKNGIRKGILLSDNRLIELPVELFERITKFLEFNGKKWGTPDSKLMKNKLNYIFESNKKGNAYTIPTLYKKFKEHCLKVGILRDLALGSLINTDLGRYISIINSELTNLGEKLIITLFSFKSEDISSLLRYYIVHLNYEEINGYKKEKVDYGVREIFSYPSMELELYSFLFDTLPEHTFNSEIENSQAVFVYANPSQENQNFIINLLTEVYNQAHNMFISFVINDPENILPDITTIVKDFRPWLQYILLNSTDLKNIGILNAIEEFFIFMLEKFHSPQKTVGLDLFREVTK